MDPETGASTWALGSHRWSEYRGIFTIKARAVRSHQVDRGRMGGGNQVKKRMLRWEFLVIRSRIASSIGRLPATV